MAATVTLDKVLALAAKLAAKDREKLFLELRERQRAVWLKKTQAKAEQAMKDYHAGKTRTLSSPEEIRAYIKNLAASDEE